MAALCRPVTHLVVLPVLSELLDTESSHMLGTGQEETEAFREFRFRPLVPIQGKELRRSDQRAGKRGGPEPKSRIGFQTLYL